MFPRESDSSNTNFILKGPILRIRIQIVFMTPLLNKIVSLLYLLSKAMKSNGWFLQQGFGPKHVNTHMKGNKFVSMMEPV